MCILHSVPRKITISILKFQNYVDDFDIRSECNLTNVRCILKQSPSRYFKPNFPSVCCNILYFNVTVYYRPVHLGLKINAECTLAICPSVLMSQSAQPPSYIRHVRQLSVEEYKLYETHPSVIFLISFVFIFLGSTATICEKHSKIYK